MTLRFLLFALVLAAVSLVLFSTRVHQGEAPTPTVLPISMAGEDGAKPGTALVVVSAAQARSKAREPADSVPAAGPPAELDFELAELAVPNAFLVDENTDRPLAGVICRLTDVNGVTLMAETNSVGALLTDEMLLTGEVALSVFQGES